MTDQVLCGEEYPDDPGITCDKVLPCYYFHASRQGGGRSWGTQPDPPKSGVAGRRKLDQMAENVKPLATVAHARSSDPKTSHAAARGLADLRPAQEEVLALFRKMGAMNDEELLAHAAASGSQQTPSGLRTRRSELVDAGLVGDTGVRRKTATGNPSIVWSCVEHVPVMEPADMPLSNSGAERRVGSTPTGDTLVDFG